MPFSSRGEAVSRPLVPVALLCVCGTVAGIRFCEAVNCYLILTGLILLLIVSFFSKGRLRKIVLIGAEFLFFLIYAVFRVEPVKEAERVFASLAGTGEKVAVSGTVCAFRRPGLASRGEVQHKFSLKDAAYRLRGEKIKTGVPIPVVWYAMDPDNGGFRPKPGMKMEMYGRVFPGKEADPAEPGIKDVFLVSRASSTRVFNDDEKGMNFLRKFRDHAADIMRQGIEDMPDETSLLLAMTLGYRAELSKSLSNSFKRAGTVHIFAISGLHVGAIALILVYLISFVGISRKYVVLPLAPMLAAYVYMTGMQPSATRAALMVFIYYLAPLLGRRPDILGSISLTLLVIVMVDPLAITEVSLILSFSMVLGIVLFTGPVSGVFRKLFGNADAMKERQLAIQAETSGDPLARVNRWPRDCFIVVWHWLVGVFSAAFAAAIVSFPLSAYFFDILTPYSLLANVVVVPLAFPVMAVAGVGLFISILFPPVAFLSNRIAACFAWLMKVVSQGVSEMPYSAFYTKFPLWALALWYIALFLLLRGVPGLISPVVRFNERRKL